MKSPAFGRIAAEKLAGSHCRGFLNREAKTNFCVFYDLNCCEGFSLAIGHSSTEYVGPIIVSKKRIVVNKTEEKLVQEIAIITNLEPTKIDAESPLHTLGMDSLKFVELLVSIERLFGVKLMESGIARKDFFTVRALSQAISKSG
jgi:acyl carrier protein